MSDVGLYPARVEPVCFGFIPGKIRQDLILFLLVIIVRLFAYLALVVLMSMAMSVAVACSDTNGSNAEQEGPEALFRGDFTYPASSSFSTTFVFWRVLASSTAHLKRSRVTYRRTNPTGTHSEYRIRLLTELGEFERADSLLVAIEQETDDGDIPYSLRRSMLNFLAGRFDRAIECLDKITFVPEDVS